MSKQIKDTTASTGTDMVPVDINDTNTFDTYDTILNDIQSNKDEFLIQEEVQETTPQDTLSKTITNQIITNFAQKNNITIKEAYVVITRMVQLGGTSASKPQLKVTLYKKDFDLNDLRTIIKLYDKKGTVRKLAKSIRNAINAIATLNNWPGSLYKDLQRNYIEGTISAEDSYFCNEFNSDNYQPDMPVKIREALLAREARIKSITSTKPKQNSKKKPRKTT